ncbi:MAG TPA: methyltransferase [Rectinemataceae bacterium]|nr:methyltransferase [Rectinemataceae bacterium]
MLDLAPLVNKTVPFKFNGAELRLDLSHALFSSYEVDAGTRLLLKTVARDEVLARSRRILDEGCGTGVIGLSVAKAFPEAEVTMRDRDSLALAFSERNRLANRLKGRTAWKDPDTGAERLAVAAPRILAGLLADGREGGPWDYILSNLPAKAGAPVLAAFFRRARATLAPGGRVAVVIVHTLAEAAELWIAEAGLEVVARGRGANHRVFVAEAGTAAGGGAAGQGDGAAKPEGGAAAQPAPGGAEGLELGGIDLSTYVRSEAGFKLADRSYRARGFWGLPEFDTIGHGSSLAAEVGQRACAGGLVREALVVNPGIGHMALWIAKALGPSRISAASRDLLSLAATGANLGSLPASSRPAYRALDALGTGELPAHSLDLIVDFLDVIPEYDWIAPAWETAARLLKRGGILIAASGPTELTRLERRRPSGWSLVADKRRRGFAATAWRLS